jgi:CSLREA domain-containing protein
MSLRLPLSLLLPLTLFAACTTDESPTAPTESGGMAAGHSAGHKVVNSLADPGDGTCNAAECTLREAIQHPEVTEISFAPGLSGPITLARSAAGGGTLVIETPLTVRGPETGMVIQRRGTDPAFRVLRIGSGVTVSLRNLTIRNGKAETGARGGGIANFGKLALTDGKVVANSPSGISNHGGTLTLTRSTVARNAADGIDNRGGGNLTLAYSTVADNLGSGISNRYGTLTLSRSTIARNSAGGRGGGIWGVWGTYSLTDVRIVGNSAAGDGGGISIFNGHLTLTNSTIAGNTAGRRGGGIASEDGSTASIISSTISGNSAAEGGGIANLALGFGRSGTTLRMTNSTLSGNTARLDGGGIFNRNFPNEARATLEIMSSTLAGNSAVQRGGGIALIGDGSLTLINSLVAQNGAPTGPDVLQGVDGASVLARFALIGDGSGSGVTNTDGNQVGSAGAPIDPKLAPLANYGGPTATHRLLPESPAIDAASTPDCPATDQREVSRPQGSACDIGSFERIVP